jgi:hypothetical protein
LKHPLVICRTAPDDKREERTTKCENYIFTFGHHSPAPPLAYKGIIIKNLIYFPYFEPSNDEWLKFSLLYLDEFRPIIPSNKREDVTSQYNKIIEETDLIKPYSPDYPQGENASTKSLEELDKYLSNPDFYKAQFNNQSILKKWRNKDKWTSLIYKEKFSTQFENFCIENKLGKKHQDGILVKKEVSHIFMSNLATEISKSLNSSIITDSEKFTNYANYKQSSELINKEKNDLAESIIKLQVPTNLKEIDFKMLIKFRNENRELIKKFNQELNKFEININEVNSINFLLQFEEIYKEIISKIAFIGAGTTLATLSILSMFDNSGSLIEEGIEASAELLGTGMTFGEILKETQNKRQCVKYFANLKKLH